jgi:Cof subfamily protein (haloacid dehalogenase superfamily)
LRFPFNEATVNESHATQQESRKHRRLLEMTSPQVRMIAIDIDGTLLPGVGLSINQRTCAALLSAEAAGIQVVIATGRRQNYAMPLLDSIGLHSETAIITSNGTVTRTFSGRHLNRCSLRPETARNLCSLLRKFRTTVFTFDSEGPGTLVLESIESLSSRIFHWVEANLSHMTVVNPLERAFERGESPIQGMVAGTLCEMDEAEALVLGSTFADEIKLHRTEYPEQDLCILDLLPPGISKAWALEKLASEQGIVREHVMAIGDNYNDLEMLEWVGHPVVMGNAHPDLQETAVRKGWELAARNDEDGVALIIENLLENMSASEAGQEGMVEFS